MTAASALPRVWVVDDSPLDAERARRALAGAYEVSVFNDGSTALEHLASENSPEVLVLDWVMPGVSGVEVCRFLRSHSGGAQKLGILLLTAHRDTRQIVEGLSAGANDYLAKPYEGEELLARVGALVRSQALLRRAERAEEALRRLLETSPDPLIVLDSRQRLSFVNDQAAMIFGESAQALRRRALTELLPNFPVSVLTPRPGESISPIPEFVVEGRYLSASVRILPATDVASSIISLRDVTEQRRLDARRLDFYSIIAHDLRSPLNVLKLRIQNTQALVRRALFEKVGNELGRLDKTLDGLVAMINDFLELASLEGASHRIKRTRTDLRALTEQVVDDYRPLLEARSQVLRLPPQRGAGDYAVQGDAQRLTQVLSNLISNAIKFTPAEGEIVVAMEAAEDHVTVSISDSGCGISEDMLPRLFERYQRAVVHNNVQGTGLGLLIVREIVEAHQGTVGVESQSGVGSRFWFRLPRAV